MVTNQGFRSLILDNDIDPFFIRYYVLYARDYLEANASGTTFKELSGSALGDLLFPIPPAIVQQKIVERIDELFAEIDDGELALARARDDLATWRKALLKAAVTGELTADWRAANPPTETGKDLLFRILADRRARWHAEPRNKGKRYVEPKAPETNAVPDLPDGWIWSNIGQISSLVTSGSRGWAEYYSDEGPLFIRAQNLNTDQLSLENIAHVTPPTNGEGSRTKVFKNDVLITITGANVTKSAIVDIDISEAYVSQHVGLVRPVMTEVAPFLYWWVVTPSGGKSILERLAYGAGKPGLNLPNLLGLPVPIPPLAEQIEITRLCEIASRERAACAAATVDGQGVAATLRQSIFAAAFRGELVA